MKGSAVTKIWRISQNEMFPLQYIIGISSDGDSGFSGQVCLTPETNLGSS